MAHPLAMGCGGVGGCGGAPITTQGFAVWLGGERLRWRYRTPLEKIGLAQQYYRAHNFSASTPQSVEPMVRAMDMYIQSGG